ncbi:sugar ABC transporter substrate-binding protein [Aurantimonas sp. VKM B-3413]|uniref:ABC transporter substrate-binding protein n=1 Tax=Aurantimonas sp. VKM B-3413 TaxID=2779401 RepID=UPI001E54581C|nr:sugar ABC transporter substrate-binding protein [Aurantimonas sp. VKM B-3413]MCB8838336.1 sugar ABC transporter substrate-binding protein [Aurantimonas sp. VKM B-3413]
MTQSLKQACGLTAALLASAAFVQAAHAQDFDWNAHKGETITFLANNNPVANAILKYKDDFEKKTGITLKVDSYQEQQMRQRLLTVLNARSDEVDVFMTLPSREGRQFAAAGWYQDLTPYTQKAVSADYDFKGLGKALVDAGTFDGTLTGIPLNIEGPLLYYRTDIFEKCGVAVPKSIADIQSAAEKIKACSDASNVTPFASRGLKPALPYTFSNFLHNEGGEYMKDGKSNLCSDAGKKALKTYADLLKTYGPPGVVNYSFYQLTSLYRAGRAAMSFQSSNEFPSVMEGGERLNDTGIMPLPAGSGGSHPTTIGWAMAVSKFSDHPEAAWYFVQWATSPQMQAKLALEGIAPPRAAAAEDADYKAWLAEQPVRQKWQEALQDLAANGTSEVGYPIIQNPESREYVGQAVDDILLGTATVDQACANADEQLNALIERE